MANRTVAPVLHSLPIRQRAGERLLAAYWPILLLVAAFVALGVRYSVTTPLFEAPDEPAHYQRVLRSAHGDAAPTLQALDHLAQGPCGSPLYYAIGALLTRHRRRGGHRYEANPMRTRRYARPGNRTPCCTSRTRVALPRRVLAARVALLSVLCAAATVAFVTPSFSDPAGASRPGGGRGCPGGAQPPVPLCQRRRRPTAWPRLGAAALYLAVRTPARPSASIVGGALGLCVGLAASPRWAPRPCCSFPPQVWPARSRGSCPPFEATLRPRPRLRRRPGDLAGGTRESSRSPGLALLPARRRGRPPARRGSPIATAAALFWGLFGGATSR